MGCKNCSRSSRRVNSTVSIQEPAIVADFTNVGPTQTKIRSGNGQQYSVLSPLVKMRPPQGWSLWIRVKGHNHFIEGSSAQEVIRSITDRYSTNDVTVDVKSIWLNANKIWVSRMSPTHTYATTADLEFISQSLVDPLIWETVRWDDVKTTINAVEYDESKVRTLVKELFDLAADKITGCELCYDDLTENAPLDYSDQDHMKDWITIRYENIVTQNAQ